MKKRALAVLAVTMFVPAVFFQSSAATQSIMQIASSDKYLGTFVTALTAADLVKTLEGPGPFTVFAPTNAAFARIPKASLDALLKNKIELNRVLTYHLVAGKLMAADVKKLRNARTLEGASLDISVIRKVVDINNARVLLADIEASNGVIHVIDTVLTPKSMK